MMYRYTWLVETPPSPLTEDASVVNVSGDYCVCEAGVLAFWSGNEAQGRSEYLICAFGPGQWLKMEITEAIAGTGNGMFAVK